MTTIATNHPTINHAFMVTEETGNNARDSDGLVDDAAILEAYCRAQIAELPRGPRGLKAAKALLVALPAAHRLGLPDTTASARQLFRLLGSAGLISDSPSDSDMPSALRLVASVCGLVTQRSPRRWTIWFSRACDPDHPLGASIREAVTPAMVRQPSRPLTASPERTAKLDELQRAHDVVTKERDKLRSECEKRAQERDALKEELHRVTQERNSLKRNNGQLMQARDELQRDYEQAKEECESAKYVLEDAKENERILKTEYRSACAEAAEARTTMKAVEAKNKTLQVQLSDLREDHRKLQKLGNSRHKLYEYVQKSIERQKSMLDEIAEIFEIGEFDESVPDDFVRDLERVFSDAKAHAAYVATECAQALDKCILHHCMAATMFEMVRRGEPLKLVEQLYQEPRPYLHQEHADRLEQFRAEFERKGIDLPPTLLTDEDLRYKLI